MNESAIFGKEDVKLIKNLKISDLDDINYIDEVN